jgi:DNA polymerase delta subunit 2
MGIDPAEEEFLRPPRSAASPHLLLFVLANICGYFSTQQYEPVLRNSSVYNPLDTFRLPPGEERQYQQQYGDMYFLRLAKLKPAVEAVAIEAWEGLNVCDGTCNPVLHRYSPSAC